MLGNNYARLNIVLGLADPYDYRGFLKGCEAQGVETMTFSTYAQKVEALLSAREQYPDLSPASAYLQHIEDNRGVLQPPAPVGGATTTSGCSGCGGGKVR